MDAAPKVSPKQLAESLRNATEAYLESVMQAVNDAPDGEWIAASEEQVRDLSAEFRKLAPFRKHTARKRCSSGSMRRKPLFPLQRKW